jgi:hypothetical protein
VALSTSACSGSRPIHEASEEIRFLEAFAAKRTAPSIRGEVYPEPGQGNDRLYTRMQKLLSGTTVSISGPDGARHVAAADARGRFFVEPVRAGEYRVSVSQAAFRSSEPEYKVSVSEGGCGVVHVAMGFDGIVSGRVREAGGKPPTATPIELIPVLGGNLYPLPIETTSRSDGTYSFVRVPPGRYFLAVNASREPSKERPYKRVFHPGVESRDRAAAISLGEAERVAGANLMLTKLGARTISARMVWADGTPAEYVHTWCAPTGDVPRQHLITDALGQITFPAMDGLSYDIGAAAASNYAIPQRRRFSAPAIRVPPGPSTSVRLVVSIPPKD